MLISLDRCWPLLWSQPLPIQRSPIAYLLHSALTVGFTCGIATTIFASQLEDLSGLTFSGVEHGPLFRNWWRLATRCRNSLHHAYCCVL